MKFHSLFIFILANTLLCSCSDSIDKKKGIKENNYIEEKKSNTEISFVENDSNLNLLVNDISIKDIRTQIKNVTHTFLSKNRVQVYPNKGTNYYFNDYALIKLDEVHRGFILGNLIIFDSIYPSRYDKNTGEFLEISLFHKGVKIYNKIEVGIPSDSIIKYFGENYKIMDSTLVYSYKKKRAFFKVNNDTISKIKIGFYRKNIDNKKILEFHNIGGNW